MTRGRRHPPPLCPARRCQAQYTGRCFRNIHWMMTSWAQAGEEPVRARVGIPFVLTHGEARGSRGASGGPGGGRIMASKGVSIPVPNLTRPRGFADEVKPRGLDMMIVSWTIQWPEVARSVPPIVRGEGVLESERLQEAPAGGRRLRQQPGTRASGSREGQEAVPQAAERWPVAVMSADWPTCPPVLDSGPQELCVVLSHLFQSCWVTLPSPGKLCDRAGVHRKAALRRESTESPRWKDPRGDWLQLTLLDQDLPESARPHSSEPGAPPSQSQPSPQPARRLCHLHPREF